MLTVYTEENEYRKIIESLPTHILMMLAAELGSAGMSTGDDLDLPIDALVVDILNIGEERLRTSTGDTPFLDLVNRWYLTPQRAIVSDWFQSQLANLDNANNPAV